MIKYIFPIIIVIWMHIHMGSYMICTKFGAYTIQFASHHHYELYDCLRIHTILMFHNLAYIHIYLHTYDFTQRQVLLQKRNSLSCIENLMAIFTFEICHHNSFIIFLITLCITFQRCTLTH